MASIDGEFKASDMQLADLNDDCTIALLKRFSSAQLFTFISSPQFSNRRLRDCAMVAVKEAYAPLSLNSFFGWNGKHFFYVADVRNVKVAGLKHPDLFQHSPLSELLDKAEIELSANFGPADLQVWLAVARSISVSKLQLSLLYTCLNTPPRGPSVRQLMQAFSSVRSLCISNDGRLDTIEIADMLDAVGVGLMRAPLRSLEIVFQPSPCIPVDVTGYLKLRLLFSHYIPRSAALESVDFSGIFLKPTSCFPAPSLGEDSHACELLLCDVLTNLKTSRALRSVKLRCHIQSISKLQAGLPEDSKIVELNGEPALSEEILKRMHCSPDKIVIVQEKQGIDGECLNEKLFLHIDCIPSLPS